MSKRNTLDYFGLAIASIQKIEKLHKEREALDIEIAKQEQFVYATANFLPDEHRKLVTERIRLFQDLTRVRDAGLADAVRAVLAAEGDWLTTTQARDRLISLQFDFGSYTTNPLASVSTTLRRMKPEDVEIGTIDGVTAYRWKHKTNTLADMLRNENPKTLSSPYRPGTYIDVTNKK
jgi:hypothetical protein